MAIVFAIHLSVIIEVYSVRTSSLLLRCDRRILYSHHNHDRLGTVNDFVSVNKLHVRQKKGGGMGKLVEKLAAHADFVIYGNLIMLQHGDVPRLVY